jgi:Ca2+-binding RTX toxin-like protein
VVELAGQGNDTVRTSLNYVLPAHVEHLILTGGADLHGTGNGLANTVTGNAGRNRLDGGSGADLLAGGDGHDTYVVNHAGDRAVEEGSSGNDTVESSVSYGLSIHVEKLVLTGSFGIDGRGNSGANIITGNAGRNFLNGGRGNDVIDGGAGNDELMGNLGNDSLRGRSGDDRFYFNVAAGAANADDILDFAAADDSLYLLRTAFRQAGPNGVLAASAFHQGAAAADAGDRILYDAASGDIFYDADGTGAAAALLFASVAAGTALTHADFVIYG